MEEIVGSITRFILSTFLSLGVRCYLVLFGNAV